MLLAERTHHFGLAVSDLEAALAWYCRTLDLTVEKRFSLDEGRLEIVKLLSGGGVRIELLKSHDEPVRPRARGRGGGAAPLLRGRRRGGGGRL